jgi:hypothetical protein
MYVLIFFKPTYDLKEYVHIDWRIWYRIRMYAIHIIWKIRHVNDDEQRWMDINGRKGPDRRNRTDGSLWTLDEIVTNSNKWWNWQNYNERQWTMTDGNDNGWWLGQTMTATDDNRWRLQRMMTVTNGDYDGQWQQWMTTTMDNDCNERRWMVTAMAMVLQKDPRPWALQRWRAEEKRGIFFFYFVFFYLLFSSSFNHLCRKPVKMEIDKWSLKKWRKTSVY